jgi:hypothetical protein
MTTQTYLPPVDQLLSLGETEFNEEWRDYRALGLADEHVPALIALLQDPRLSWESWSQGQDETPFWGPLHAWRALGQLGAPQAAEPLIRILLRDEDNDWAIEEIPRALGMIGAPALQTVLRALVAAARDPDPGDAIRLCAPLQKIGERPEAREPAIAALVRQLRVWPNQNAELNAFLISALVDLRAVESAPVMREAFEAGAVDESVCGDWEEVQVELGLLAQRTTPPPHYDHGLGGPVRHARVLSPALGSGTPAARSRQLRKAQKQAAKKSKKRRK